MKHIIKILLLILSVVHLSGLVGCLNKRDYLIIKLNENISTKNGCSAILSYPLIKTFKLEKNVERLNTYLKEIFEINKIIRECSLNISSKEIKLFGEYSIILETDSLVCLEYNLSNSLNSDTIYKAIFINPKEFKIVEIENLFNSNKLIPWIKKYIEEKKVDINLSIYEENNWKSINYGLTDASFVLYMGGEGEFYGNHKIKISLNDLK